jgi:thymidine kinase
MSVNLHSLAAENGTGSIQIITGPMFSAKTSSLLAAVDTTSLARQKCLLVLHADDQRYGADPCAHSGAGLRAGDGRAEVEVVRAHRLAEVRVPDNTCLIAVDEGQFYPDLPEACDAWADRGFHVFVAALDGTYERVPFGRVGELLPLCDKIEKRSAVCMVCRRRPAPFTQRLGRQRQVKVVGGAESYRAVCRSCRSETTIEAPTLAKQTPEICRPEMENPSEIVSRLDRTFTQVLEHPFIRALDRRGVPPPQDDNRVHFLSVLNSVRPITQSEKDLAHFVRILAAPDRERFIRGALSMRRGCLCFYAGGDCIARALHCEHHFSIYDKDGQFCIGPPDSALAEKAAVGGHSRRRRRSGRRGGRGGRGAPRDQRPGRRSPRPAMDDDIRQSLLDGMNAIEAQAVGAAGETRDNETQAVGTTGGTQAVGATGDAQAVGATGEMRDNETQAVGTTGDAQASETQAVGVTAGTQTSETQAVGATGETRDNETQAVGATGDAQAVGATGETQTSKAQADKKESELPDVDEQPNDMEL